MIEDVEQEMKRLGVLPKIDSSAPSTARVEQLELTLGVKLPADYRYFLSKYGDCRIVASFECKTMTGTYIEWFHGFRSYGEDDGPTRVHNFDDLCIAPVAITIGCDIFGNLIAMFLDDAQRGKVYYYQHDGFADFKDDPNWQSSGLSWKDLSSFDETDDKPEAFQNLHFVADSFVAFLQKLSKIDAKNE